MIGVTCHSGCDPLSVAAMTAPDCHNCHPSTIGALGSPASLLYTGGPYTVIVNGFNFTSTTKLLLDGVPQTTTLSSPTQVRFTVPVGYAAAPKLSRITISDDNGPGAGSLTLSFVAPP